MVFRRREELPDKLPPAVKKKKSGPTVISRRDEAKKETEAPSVPTYDVQTIQTIEQPPPWPPEMPPVVDELGLGSLWRTFFRETPSETPTWGDYYSEGSSYRPETQELLYSPAPTNVWVGQGGLGGDLSANALVDASRQTALAFFGAAYGGTERYGLAPDALIPTDVSQEVLGNIEQFFTPKADAGITMWEESFGYVPESAEEGMLMLGYFQKEDGDWHRYDASGTETALSSYLGGGSGRGYGYGYGYPSYGRAGGYSFRCSGLCRRQTA